ncbi:Cof-type HAD-IIB family hydrolase [Entomohabitans teleogrylli]|uniref:Cof-type HAD-IIB family hydrolase n=1 Tax=Entomohabitans teleogrylli TaxID=1384589 RepID=UPI00073DB1CD|nr:Cof-type HAD-IIB family hydrolase [Entomohabitans teleogrylli]
MAVKMIAVDMDGTFLDDRKTYNRPRFLEQYRQLKEQGIRFVVASGNQYYQLISFFPEIADEISFVAENGGWVVSEGEDLFNGEISAADYAAVVERLKAFPEIEVIACGKKQAWTLSHYSDEVKEMVAMYYHRLQVVDELDGLEDIFFKFGLNVPHRHQPETLARLNAALDGLLVPVSSGHGSIDLIIPGIHKANGLRILQDRWGIDDSEVMAFGDSGNDLEMLRQSRYSFAMANAAEAAKAAARYRAPHNNEQGVLEIIDKLLVGQAPFND